MVSPIVALDTCELYKYMYIYLKGKLYGHNFAIS